MSVPEYDLPLSNGEILRIAEYNFGLLESEFITILKNRNPPLDRLTYVNAGIMEEVKIGYDRNFVSLLRTPPISLMQKVGSLKCYDRRECASYDPIDCLMRMKPVREPKAFPVCWQSDRKDDVERMLWTSILFHVREGRNVIIVTD